MNDHESKVERQLAEIKSSLSKGTSEFENIRSTLSQLQDLRDDEVRRQRRAQNLVMLLATVAALAGLTAGVLSVIFALNSGSALQNQQDVSQALICAQVRSTAAGVHRAQPGEAHRHFLRRMYAQRETLLAAGALDCPSLPGFFSFSASRSAAIADLDRILDKVPEFRHPGHPDLGISAPNRYRPPQLVASSSSPTTRSPGRAPTAGDGPGASEQGQSGDSGAAGQPPAGSPGHQTSPPSPPPGGDGQPEQPTTPPPTSPGTPSSPGTTGGGGSGLVGVDLTPVTDPVHRIVCHLNLVGIRVCL